MAAPRRPRCGRLWRCWWCGPSTRAWRCWPGAGPAPLRSSGPCEHRLPTPPERPRRRALGEKSAPTQRRRDPPPPPPPASSRQGVRPPARRAPARLKRPSWMQSTWAQRAARDLGDTHGKASLSPGGPASTHCGDGGTARCPAVPGPCRRCSWLHRWQRSGPSSTFLSPAGCCGAGPKLSHRAGPTAGAPGRAPSHWRAEGQGACFPLVRPVLRVQRACQDATGGPACTCHAGTGVLYRVLGSWNGCLGLWGCES